jgi:signal transduction histidine kinase
MSYTYISASSEFAALCRSQLRLLSQSHSCLWSAVYLKEELVEGRQGQLSAFAIYPPNEEEWQQKFLPSSLPEVWQELNYQSSLTNSFYLPSTTETKTTKTHEWETRYRGRQKLILPLIYDNVAMGLLMMGREDQEWEEEELSKIEEIAHTIALARFLDQRQTHYQKQLAVQQNLRQLEQDRIDILLHQLRNPLTALRTFSKLLLKRLLPQDRNHSVAENLLRESDRLEELLEQFETSLENRQEEKTPLTLSTTSVLLSSVDFSHHSNFLLPSSSSKVELVQIKDVLEPLLITAKAIAAEKNIDFIANIPENLPTVVANGKGLREVINNLIDNALKYTPAQGRVEVEIKVKPEENKLGIAIKDTGYGIPLQEQKLIFERHYRGIQESGDIPGSGLGLAIAKDLVEQMQGQIELISPNNLGKDSNFPGTTFIVWLSLEVISNK